METNRLDAPTVVREEPGGEEAHRVMEAGEAGGKMVVVLD
jgi:hypothetical protein